MDRAKDEALRRTSAAVTSYGVGEDRVAAFGRLLSGPSLGRATYTGGYMHARLLAAAEDHRGQCTSDGCVTCQNLGEALAMMLAFLRAELNAEFAEQMRPPRRRRWLPGGQPPPP